VDADVRRPAREPFKVAHLGAIGEPSFDVFSSFFRQTGDGDNGRCPNESKDIQPNKRAFVKA
jgi:hypothetical protein